MPDKADAAEIVEFLQELKAERWLGRQRRDWPSYCYHYTDVQNAASILRTARLLSRERCRTEGHLVVDAAHRGIIDQTDYAHQYVRLYFRPRTPTQYRQEGHRPGLTDADPHCPVPVFFLFDSESLLTQQGCMFSNGNLAAARHRTGDSAAFLRSMDFRSIYHDGWFAGGERDDIVFARNAEVLFEGEFGLEALREVVCRTAAERDTLLSLLGGYADRWRPLVRVERQGERLYFREWAYIKDVQLLDDSLLLSFRPLETFALDIQVHSPGGEVQTLSRRYRLQQLAKLDLQHPADYVAVRIRLDGNVAFRGRVNRTVLFGGGADD